MFNCPYASIIDDSYRVEAKNSFVRVLHASPNSPPVDIYANNKRLVKNLAYKEFTEYLTVPSGSYNIKVYPAGKKINPVIDTNMNILPSAVITLAAVGLLPNISLYPVLEPVLPRVAGRACIRFINLAPDTAPIDLTRLDGKKIFSNVQYKGVTDYVCISSGRFALQLRDARDGRVLLTDPNIHLLPDRHYSIYGVGTVGGQEPLQILIALDGSSYIPR